MRSEEQNKKAILAYLKKNGKSFMKKIAKGANLSEPTASKYLHTLEGEKKVRKEIQAPYVYYELSER
ncbi:winged helix-turn-helix domain-containing protein [Candidatus Bathyarchaeota archaeon]|nr:winged helix-turn-helix domain-containing protein [Candidatus Bathyarchaeota archaeon]